MTDKKTDEPITTASTTKTTDDGPSLLPEEKFRTEEHMRRRYAKQLSTVVLFQGPVIGWTLYAILKLGVLSEDSRQLLDSKFDAIREYDLNYVYIAVFLVYMTRLVMTTNSNGARGPTRLNRPDQHIYQVVGTDQIVLMATQGAAGRFNRAQRAIFNMDESLSLFLVSILLVAPVLGPLVCFVLVPMYSYGRIVCAEQYKRDVNARTGGFMYAMVAEHGLAALVGLIAVQSSSLGTMIPI